MEAILKLLLPIHIFAGFTSIIIFWIPIFVKKGSSLHIIVGKVYVILMWIVVISAALLSIENFINGRYIMAAFLGFLSLITANPLWYGIAILKHKKGLSSNYRKKHMYFNLLIVITGFLLIVYGIILKGQNEGLLMLIFGVLGISTGRDIYLMYKNHASKSNWISEHITGMLTSGIAAYTAFAVFGGANFFRGILQGSFLQILPWILPGILGGIGINYYKKGYMKKPKISKS